MKLTNDELLTISLLITLKIYEYQGLKREYEFKLVRNNDIQERELYENNLKFVKNELSDLTMLYDKILEMRLKGANQL